METVDLLTRTGGFVASVEIPPFKSKPEALAWGERVFFWDEERAGWYEGYVYVVPPHYKVG